MSIDRETSYGGVVVREGELLVITPAGKRATALPKGRMEAGETPEQVALREVQEETGIVASTIRELGDVRYTYWRSGRRIRKTVHFFLCSYIDGSTADHNDEVDDARWIDLESARDQLSFPGERALIERLLAKTGCER